MNQLSLKQPMRHTFRKLSLGVVFAATALTQVVALAGPPRADSNIDYAASGFQLPAGVAPAAWAMAAAGPNYAARPVAFDPMMPGGASSIPATFPSAPMSPAMMAPPVPTGLPAPMGPAAYQAAMQMPTGSVMPVGFFQGGAACDAMMGYPPMGCDCGTSCDCSGGCAGGSCGGGFSGILPAVMGDCGCGGRGCGHCMSKVMDTGCLGQGGLLGEVANGDCGMMSDFGLLAGALGASLQELLQTLRPYSEAGACSQRWYDVSAEVALLGHSLSGVPKGLVVGNFGNGVGGVPTNPTYTIGDAVDEDLEAGMRLSLALIAGPGGNVEFTYLGGQEWDGNRSVSVNDDSLTSFLSGYGNLPANGFETVDTMQTVDTSFKFHSGEINYRRRTVGPYCKFQGSWLVGLRYLRYDNDLTFEGRGDTGLIRVFTLGSNIDNEYFGAQAGFDFWYNLIPGVRMGFGLKGAWVQNEWERDQLISSTGDALNQRFSQFGDEGTFITDFEYKINYRVTREWAVRVAYQLINIKDVMAPTFSTESFIDAGGNLNVTGPPALNETSATIQGLTVGAEYTW